MFKKFFTFAMLLAVAMATVFVNPKVGQTQRYLGSRQGIYRTSPYFRYGYYGARYGYPRNYSSNYSSYYVGRRYYAPYYHSYGYTNINNYSTYSRYPSYAYRHFGR